MITKYLHTMIRVKDLDRSLTFYTNVLGLELKSKRDFEHGKFTLAFLGIKGVEGSKELELTYNWDGRDYELGSAFGHLAYLVDDIYKTCDDIKSLNGEVVREAGAFAGSTSIIAFIKDPDGYLIELIEEKTA